MNIFTVLVNFLFPQDPFKEFLEQITSHYLLAHCLKTQGSSHSYITSTFSYKDECIQKIIWLLKYEKSKTSAQLCAHILLEECIHFLQDEISFGNFTYPLFMPIPLSKQRYKERGYNQCEWLITEMFKEHQLPGEKAFNILVRIKHTESQTSKNKKERKENIQNSFSITDTSLIKNKDIILIDDVTTTGSTLREAYHTLLEAGARNIHAFTIAH